MPTDRPAGAHPGTAGEAGALPPDDSVDKCYTERIEMASKRV